jgi:protein-disulfide isomerase
VVGDGPVVVDAYIDFQCPFCRAFEMTSGDAVRAMATDGLITLVVHPMDFLDEASTNHYSSRAASASGCASDADRFSEYAQVLLANQPPEGGPGLTDEQLVELGVTVGLTEPSFVQCVPQHVYVPWADRVTQLALARGVSGTPTTLVDGVPVPANARAIAAAVGSALR